MPCPVKSVSFINDAPRASVPGPTTQRTTLVTQSQITHTYTANRETDARTAVLRGLAEYVSSLSIQAPGGRLLSFSQVYQTWAQPEDLAVYPSVIAYADGPGEYDASKFSGQGNLYPIVGNQYLLSTSELTLDINLEIWATDPEERIGLVAMLEDGLSPVDFMYGIRLVLPHYFGEVAEYEPRSLVYLDTAEDAMRRHRRAMMVVRSRMPVTRLMTAVPINIRLDADEVSTAPIPSFVPPNDVFVSPIPVNQ